MIKRIMWWLRNVLFFIIGMFEQVFTIIIMLFVVFALYLLGFVALGLIWGDIVLNLNM